MVYPAWQGCWRWWSNGLHGCLMTLRWWVWVLLLLFSWIEFVCSVTDEKTSAEAITGKIKKLMRAYRLYIKDDGSVLQTSSHFIIERLNETFKRGFSRFPTNLSRFEDSARITRKDTNRKFGFKVKRSPIFSKWAFPWKRLSSKKWSENYFLMYLKSHLQKDRYKNTLYSNNRIFDPRQQNLGN